MSVKKKILANINSKSGDTHILFRENIIKKP